MWPDTSVDSIFFVRTLARCARLAYIRSTNGGREPAANKERPMSTFRTKFHRDGSITLWDVYTQAWERTSRPSDRQLAAMPEGERERAIRHTGR